MILSFGQRRGLHGKWVILRHIERTGCTIAGTPVWTQAEVDILRRCYPDRNAACTALPSRTRIAVAQKAQRLGLVPPLRKWSDDQAIKLGKPYRAGVPITALVEMFPDKSPEQIWSKAHHMGYRRPRRAPKPTGMLLVDDIRMRAFEHRLSMTDLDAFVGKKRYFVSPRHVDWRALQKAMEILGGRPIVLWADR